MTKKPGKKRKSSPKKSKGIWEALTHPRWFLLLTVVVSFIIYAPSLNNDLVFLDDDVIFDNLSKVEVTTLSEIVSESFKRDAMVGIGGDLYRPVQTLYFIAVYKAGNGSLFLFHLLQVWLHILVCFTLFYLLKLMGADKFKAATAVAIYMTHPLFVSAVAFIPSIGDQFLVFFGLLSIVFYIKNLRKASLKNAILSLLFLALAVFSKETAVFLPVIFIAYAIYHYNYKVKDVFKAGIVINLLIGFVVVGLYFFVRQQYVLPRLVSAHNELTISNFITNLGQNFPSFFEYQAKFIWPFGLSFLTSYSSINTILGILALCALALLWFFKKIDTSKLLFALLWYLVFVLPPMLYNNPLFDYGEQRAYMPLIAFVMIIAFIRVKPVVFKFLWLLPLILGFMAHERTKDFSSPPAFYNAIIENSDVPLAYLNRGAYYHKNYNDVNQALSDYNKAIALKEDYATAFYNRAIIMSEEFKRMEDALRDVNRAIEVRPAYADAYYHRGYIKITGFGNIEQGIADMTKAIEINPLFIQAYNNRGVVYLSYKNDPLTALKDFDKSIEISPLNNGAAYYFRGLAHHNLNNKEMACYDWQSSHQQGEMRAQNMLEVHCR